MILPDGRIVYENSMTHFAPAHPGSVSLYDPRADRDVRVYPAKRDEIVNLDWIDRGIGEIQQVGPDTIRFRAVEQDIRIGRDNRGIPRGPERRSIVTCDLAPPQPVCTVRPAPH